MDGVIVRGILPLVLPTIFNFINIDGLLSHRKVENVFRNPGFVMVTTIAEPTIFPMKIWRIAKIL